MPRKGWGQYVVRPVLISLAAMLFAPLLLDGAESGANTGAELAQLYQQGMGAFQAGNYPLAASTLETLLSKAEFSAQLEPAYFTVGSAWFNVPDYKKAITAFKAYQTKFPNGA